MWVKRESNRLFSTLYLSIPFESLELICFWDFFVDVYKMERPFLF